MRDEGKKLPNLRTLCYCMPVILGGPRILHYRMKLAFLARYEDAKSAPKRTYKHAKITKFFRGYTPELPYHKGRGGVG
jgi:hypothetical protein